MVPISYSNISFIKLRPYQINLLLLGQAGQNIGQEKETMNLS